MKNVYNQLEVLVELRDSLDFIDYLEQNTINYIPEERPDNISSFRIPFPEIIFKKPDNLLSFSFLVKKYNRGIRKINWLNDDTETIKLGNDAILNVYDLFNNTTKECIEILPSGEAIIGDIYLDYITNSNYRKINGKHANFYYISDLCLLNFRLLSYDNIMNLFFDGVLSQNKEVTKDLYSLAVAQKQEIQKGLSC